MKVHVLSSLILFHARQAGGGYHSLLPSVGGHRTHTGGSYKTLGRYVKLQENEGPIDNASFGYQTEKKRVLNSELEEMLLNYILESSSIYYGLT